MEEEFKFKCCGYKNCNNLLSSRPGVKYCSHKCRAMAYKYVQRENERVEKERIRVKNLIEEYKNQENINNDVVELYKKLYCK